MELTVEKTGLLSGKKHLFVFEAFSVQVQGRARVDVGIQSRSLRCKDTWVVAKDLKKIERTALDDMHAASRFPDLTFHSTSLREVASDQFEVTGNLTIRDVTKPVVVDVSTTGPQAYKGTARFKLSDFGLKPPTAALGLIGTKDEMTLRFSLGPTT